MEFLKDVLGEELYNQMSEKVNAYNEDAANNDKQIKLGNLGSGEYVAKGKFDALSESLTGKDTELQTANQLISELKKATKGNEEIQGKVKQYEDQVTDLQQQLAETKLKSAIKVALLSEKAVDVDYLTYKLNEKLKEKGSSLELDENDNIKGWTDHLSGLKTQFPAMFETSQSGGDKKIIDPNTLPDPNVKEQLTRADILKKPYAERMKLYTENPEAYNAAMNA